MNEIQCDIPEERKCRTCSSRQLGLEFDYSKITRHPQNCLNNCAFYNVCGHGHHFCGNDQISKKGVRHTQKYGCATYEGDSV